MPKKFCETRHLDCSCTVKILIVHMIVSSSITKPSKNREIKRKNEKESEKALKKLLAKEYSTKQKAGQQIVQERQTTKL